MQLVRSILFISLVFILPDVGVGQVSLLSLQSNSYNYKQALKESKTSGMPVLAILYSSNYPVTTTNKLIEADKIIQNAGVIPIVIDWMKAPNSKPQKYLQSIQNPSWLLIHHDEAIIHIADQIILDDSLSNFFHKGMALYQKMNTAYEQRENSKDPEGHFLLAKACQEIADATYTSEALEGYLKRMDKRKLTDQRFHDLIKMGMTSPNSKRLNKLITQNRDWAMLVASKDTVLRLQHYYILNDLNKKDLLEPYFVWERFEKELGYEADSLYRIFAISYMGNSSATKHMQYNEAFDYINLYPRSPWEYLEQLYKIIVPATTSKEDLDILLDLISFQLFRGEDHVKLDYKALILYKLGQKERALSMISDINTMALSQGLIYKSMLYSLK